MRSMRFMMVRITRPNANSLAHTFVLFKPSFVLVAAPLRLPTALTARNLWIVGPCDGVVHILFTTQVQRAAHARAEQRRCRRPARVSHEGT
jgi:hypothetical protein